MKSKFLALLVAGGVIAGASSLLLAADAGSGPRVVKIRAGADNVMKFDVASITAAPGETIKVVVTNATTLPKNVMGHNWVLLTKGTDPVAFAASAAADAKDGYIPSKAKDQVLAFIALLGPDEVGEVTFKAPAEPGEYPFLCTFPAHCLVGMKGVLVVKK
ncbi:MAG: plastocyanin/azurin family copper-binding protein [Opitutaceae bacterium]|nr:plastocyanin/azurin family copper-binding protein [Opitutaceae bacterium]